MNKNITLFLILINLNFLMASCGSSVDGGNNQVSAQNEKDINKVDNKSYTYQKSIVSLSGSEIDFLKNAPVNNKILIPMLINFSEFEKNILKSGYIKNEKNTAILNKRYEIESIFDNVAKIYFFNSNDELPEIYSTIFSNNKQRTSYSKIVVNLSFDYDESNKKYRKIDTDDTVPMIFVESLSGVNKVKANQVYRDLLKKHIIDIEKNINKYGDFLVTNRAEYSGYFFEFNTLQLQNNTFFYIYKASK